MSCMLCVASRYVNVYPKFDLSELHNINDLADTKTLLKDTMIKRQLDSWK